MTHFLETSLEVESSQQNKLQFLRHESIRINLIFSTHQPLNSGEIDKAEDVSETETESSPSGYGTETSGEDSDSSDTDIDAIVDEYRDESSMPTAMRECSFSHKLIKGPSQATANVVKMATAVLLLSFLLQFVILDNVKSSTMINAVILNLGISVAVFVLLLVISKQPSDKSRTDFTFIMPLTPWSQALAMFLNLSLLARVLHSAWLELFLWIFLGNDFSI